MAKTREVKWTEVIEGGVKYIGASRAFQFDFNIEQNARDIKKLMERGLTYDDAEKVLTIKLMLRYASQFQEMHAELLAEEDYKDADVVEFIRELNQTMLDAEILLVYTANGFCGKVFGDKPLKFAA